jgi:hypothetical protein
MTNLKKVTDRFIQTSKRFYVRRIKDKQIKEVFQLKLQKRFQELG